MASLSKMYGKKQVIPDAEDAIQERQAVLFREEEPPIETGCSHSVEERGRRRGFGNSGRHRPPGGEGLQLGSPVGLPLRPGSFQSQVVATGRPVSWATSKPVPFLSMK